MYETKPLTALEPKLTLIADAMPPLGRKIYMVSEYGNGILGDYHPELGIVAWAPLPKLTKEQRKRIEEMKNENSNRGAGY